MKYRKRGVAGMKKGGLKRDELGEKKTDGGEDRKGQIKKEGKGKRKRQEVGKKGAEGGGGRDERAKEGMNMES